MFRHILVPTDGSRGSELAVEAAIELAKALKARITAVHVVAEAPALALEGWAHHDRQFGTHLEKAFEKRAVLLLEDVRDRARLEGIACECRIAHGNSPAGEILRIAEEDGCDLIFIGAGGTGAASAPVSRETLELIAASPVPVLLHREPRRGAA